ncbi:MAG: SDR family NAD(P)-dependent oxidoreductase [Chitinophagaceae bacterium]
MKNSFEGQIAMVTGAASGLGFVVAKRLYNEGVKLVMIDQNEEELHQAALQLPGTNALFAMDVSNEQLVKQAVAAAVTALGAIDILVNCAGITGITAVKSHEAATADVQKVFNINFFGSWYTSKYVLPHMLANNYGRILHFASIAGKEGNAGMLAYSASKAAVIGMTKVQGKEYADTGITVNALAPAVIRTALVDAMPADQVKYMTDKIPMKRCGTIGEVADIATYIVSPRNSFTTGFVFDLSGGRATY